jgi:hypothetical protein
MGSTAAPQFAESLIQLVIRSKRPDSLVQSDADWNALGRIAARMLFWCGGAIYACRCEGNEMRLAIRVAHAPVGSMAHHLSGAYAIHLRQSRGLAGGIFKHYTVLPLESANDLDELVLWLHRPGTTPVRAWTTDPAYEEAEPMPWITTHLFEGQSAGETGPATYRRRKSEALSREVIERFNRRPQRLDSSRSTHHACRAQRTSIDFIAHLAAEYCKVSYEDMLTDTRKRAESKARVITAVLATRNGATAAAAARLFNRSRSTLIEQVEHYRATQPEVFGEAEALLEASLRKKGLK